MGQLVPGELAAERLERGVKLGLPVLLLTRRHPPAPRFIPTRVGTITERARGPREADHGRDAAGKHSGDADPVMDAGPRGMQHEWRHP
jgi:hypothetical protein